MKSFGNTVISFPMKGQESVHVSSVGIARAGAMLGCFLTRFIIGGKGSGIRSEARA